MKEYNISISSSNLGRYFSDAIIKPHSYYREIDDDFQSQNNTVIILTDDAFVNNTDCCLQVELSDKELKKNTLFEGEGFLFYGGLLPITRVKSILFLDKEKKENVITLARSSAFIPEYLVKVIKDRDSSNKTVIVDDGHKSEMNFEEKIDRYNRFLGGLAFMKIATEQSYFNYSENYFSIVGFFNSKIKSNLELNIKCVETNDSLTGMFDDENKNYADFRKYVYGKTHYITKYFDKQGIQSSSNFYITDNISKSKIKILSYLVNYGPKNNTPRKTDSLIKLITENKVEKKDAIAFFFGLHNGYQNLEKYYSVNDSSVKVKYELNSKLDYYTIESVYNYVINGEKHADIDYIEDRNIVNVKKVDTKKYKTYKIIDEDIIYSKVPTSIKDVFDEFRKCNDYKRITTHIYERLNKLFGKKKNNSDELQKQGEEIIIAEFQNISNTLFGEVQKFHNEELGKLNDEIIYLKKTLTSLKQENYDFFMLLKHKDKNLFEEIDTNNDGEIQPEEMLKFIIDLKKANLKYKDHLIIASEVEEAESVYASENESGNSYNESMSTIVDFTRFNAYVIGAMAKSLLGRKVKDVKKENIDKFRKDIINKLNSELF
jgi:hypothetical protein